MSGLLVRTAPGDLALPPDPPQPPPGRRFADLMDADSDGDDLSSLGDGEEQDGDQDNGAAGARPARDRIPLHELYRIIVGERPGGRQPAASNDTLVDNLRRGGTLTSEPVARALRACPRDAFVPEGYAGEALLDVPLRLEGLGFNVSAPHMHAACLEALALTPGLKVLDVGSGCGLITACAAYLVGKTGAAVGIDVRPAAVRLARRNVARLAVSEAGAAWARAAGPVAFSTHNVFLPSNKHKGQYDRVHCGASCEPRRLRALLALLRPSGGLIVTPVTPSDLRLIELRSDGSVTQKVLSQVRYSELEVPSDADVVLATLRMERRARTAFRPPPSSFAADVASINGGSTPSGSLGSCVSDHSGFAMSPPTSPSGSPDDEAAGGAGGEGGRRWPRRVAKFLTACGGNLRASPGASSSQSSAGGGERMSLDGGGGASGPDSPPPPRLVPEDLGPHDCALVGAGWHLPAHRAVLRARCDHFAARCASGMRDADAAEVPVPEHFSKEAVASFLHYAYHDELGPRADAESALAALAVAQYLGAPRLAALCEARLGAELKGMDPGDEGTAEAACDLLALADEGGLPQLAALALDHIVTHHDLVARTPAYAALPRACALRVAGHACGLLARAGELLADVSAQYAALPKRY